MSVHTEPPATPLLPLYVLGSRSPTWWGMIGLIAIEIVVFGGLIAMYFWLKLANPSWPPEGIAVKPLLLPTINTVILIASGVAMIVAKRAIVRGNQLVLKLGQVVALILGLVFFTLKIVEYSGYDYDWSTHAYGSITWTMTGFHAAHVISVVFKGIIVLLMSLRGMFRPDRHLAFEVSTLYWVFVVVIWLPLYFTMYISPRL
ncbi:MAG: heme-copper oxidase subunit III [Trueperaceae bacterium]|nr:heme-copper oxidase subunit III [Trueperaceae bacterium]